MARCAVCGHESPEAFKFCPECGAPAAERPPGREQRKVVTVLFCDITGSTALGERLDPESLRALLARYFEQMKAIVERHGGTVEKFVGDAVMAVFGVPLLHEDDALRAVRAAAEMRAALPDLGVEGRIGVATGEVVTGTEERLATGDAVNVAARLEQAAQPGEVLLSAETLRFVRAAVEVELLEPLALKGKSAPVAAYRLIAVGHEPERQHDAPMVGRARQRRLLDEAFASVAGDRACHLFTILGAAGVGKSRLAAEFLAGVDARVMRGRCLSYGDGITYWPVVEVLKQLGADPVGPLASLLGESDAPTSPDDIAWAVRKALEQAAADGPLVVVFDDLHWGEPVFLELIGHVADLSRDAPILLLCMARPDLLERAPGWAGGKVNATTVLLEPLSSAEADELIERLAPVDDRLRARIRDAAEGNPLFVEEMVALVRESGDADVVVPPTIHALLAARLDQLDAPERIVLERAAVEGGIFHRGAVEALAPEERHVPARLTALVRKELVRPDRAQLAGDEAFRFRHLLIRDAAYDALPKALRAELHERFAIWLDEHGADLVELDEIVGYHLEQACRYRSELELPSEKRLLAAGGARLLAAGRRAFTRDDYAAAAKLLERAASLLAPDVDDWLEFDLAAAWFFSGRPTASRERQLALAAQAEAAGDSSGANLWRIHAAITRMYVEPEGAVDELAVLVERARPAAETDFARFTVAWGRSQMGHMHGRFDKSFDARQEVVGLTRRLGLTHLEALFTPGLANALYFGSHPVDEVLAAIGEAEARAVRHREFDLMRALSLAMLGRFDEARSLLERMRTDLREMGSLVPLALALAHASVEVELRAGNYAAAVEFGEEGCRLLEEAGQPSWLSTAAAMLGQAYYGLGHLDQAEGEAERAAQLGASDDAVTQIVWRQVRAKVLARRGELGAAEALAREAVAVAAATDLLDSLGQAYTDLAEVLTLDGRQDAASAALSEAIACFDRKGSIVSAERARSRLAMLGSPAPTA